MATAQALDRLRQDSAGAMAGIQWTAGPSGYYTAGVDLGGFPLKDNRGLLGGNVHAETATPTFLQELRKEIDDWIHS
jgi:hypothetical protein